MTAGKESGQYCGFLVMSHYETLVLKKLYLQSHVSEIRDDQSVLRNFISSVYH